MTFERMMLMVMRVSIAFQVVVGLALWAGHWKQLTDAHVNVGILFVLLLWFLGVTRLVKGPDRALAALAIAWGAAVGYVGFTQQSLLLGDLHWVVRPGHLAIGMLAMPIAERLGKSGRR